ncbi:hypothetical protein POM88_019132 [Heracleum sosnowskyi]|uniref:Uncharacterized protein n=1 Tax=Heracleum sosnowskyi TaxID=360622 RepID=A0AAD8IRS2_9APIA|nr:hypothetical protein POM88_019132 [Heracleum sosnowskyi]
MLAFVKRGKEKFDTTPSLLSSRMVVPEWKARKAHYTKEGSCTTKGNNTKDCPPSSKRCLSHRKSCKSLRSNCELLSKFQWNKCRRIITDTRSSLSYESVETLMCVKDWLPDLKDGKSEKVVEDGSSMILKLKMCVGVQFLDFFIRAFPLFIYSRKVVFLKYDNYFSSAIAGQI